LLHCLRSYIAEYRIYLNEHFGLRENFGMLLLDVEKVFDCVWHDALLHQLLGYRFPTETFMLMLLVRGLQNVGSLLECHRVQFFLRHSSLYLLLIFLP
jgi:hypothetical protein